jgi:hypothetical protein
MKNIVNMFKKICGIKTKDPCVSLLPIDETKEEEEIEPVLEKEKEKEKPVFDLLTMVTQRVQEEALTIGLSKSELEFLDHIIKNNPALFLDIHEEMQKIIHHGVLHIHDIPELVLLLSRIFHIHFIENCMEEFGVVNMVQFILDCILDANVLHINDVEIQILKKVIKTSLSLLEMNVVIQKEIVCCQGWLGFFSKK